MSGSVHLSAVELADRADRLLTHHIVHMTDHDELSANAMKRIATLLKVGVMSRSAGLSCVSSSASLQGLPKTLL